MRNIIKILLAFIVVTIIVTSCRVDDYSLGTPYSISEDKVTFSMTKGSDEYNYSFSANVDVDAVKYPYTTEIRFGDFFAGTDLYAEKNEQVSKNLTGTFEYIVPAGKYLARFLVYTPNGNVVIKDKEIVIAVDNEKLYLDDPASLQFALTGGRDNIEGKQWQLGAWAALRSANNLDEVWWPFANPYTADGNPGDKALAIIDDFFTFIPNKTQPNGDFVHENNGDSFMNESLGNLFPDGDTGGSFVTVNYFPPTDAKWEVSQVDGKYFLTIKKGFLGYPIAPENLVETTYEVIDFSPTSIKLGIFMDWGGVWAYELVSEGIENLWSGVTFTNTFYYAPNWAQLPDPTLVISGNTYSLSFPNATFEQWQNQLAFVTENLATTSAKNYNFSVMMNASNDIDKVTVKLTQNEDPGTFIFTERIDLKAGEDIVLDLKDMPGKDMPKVELVFDFGGNPDNTDVVIKNIILQEVDK